MSARIIRSTWQKADINDLDTADVLTDAIDDAIQCGTVRKSTDGTELACVVAYTDPETGAALWAFHYTDEAGTEYIDYTDLAAAEAAYEEQVRGLQSCVDGVPDPVTGTDQCWWGVTDVPGVPSKSQARA